MLIWPKIYATNFTHALIMSAAMLRRLRAYMRIPLSIGRVYVLSLNQLYNHVPFQDIASCLAVCKELLNTVQNTNDATEWVTGKFNIILF